LAPPASHTVVTWPLLFKRNGSKSLWPLWRTIPKTNWCCIGRKSRPYTRLI